MGQGTWLIFWGTLLIHLCDMFHAVMSLKRVNVESCLSNGARDMTHFLRDMTHSSVWYVSLSHIPQMGECWVMFSNGWRNMTLLFVWHDSFICVICFTHLRDVTHPFEGRDSPIWGTWLNTTLVHAVDQACARYGSLTCVLHDWFMCVAWLIHVCDMAHSCVWRDSIICVTWLIHAWLIYVVTWLIHLIYMTRSHAWPAPFICVASLFHTHDTTHACVRHTSVIYGTWLNATYGHGVAHSCVMWLIYICNVPHSHIWHSYVWHDSFICVTCLIQYSFTCVTWLIHIRNRTHFFVWHNSFTCVTWLIRSCDITHLLVRPNSFLCVT